MLSAGAGKGKLFYKLLFILLIVSLGPLGVAGYYMLGISQETLRKSTLADQKSLAVGFADSVYNFVNTFRNILSDAARSDDISSMIPGRQKDALERLMQQNAHFLSVSVLDLKGRETARADRFEQEGALQDTSAIFQKTMLSGEFTGGLERFMGSFPTLAMAFQTVNMRTGKAAGVITARLSLNGLSSMLKTGFAESSHTEAAIAAPGGFLIADSDIVSAFRPGAALPIEVRDFIFKGAESSGGGEIRTGGKTVLAAFAEVRDLGWMVCIHKPVSIAYKAAEDMLSRTYRTMLIVVVFVLIMSYLVSSIVVAPIEVLREASSVLSEGRFDDLPELKMPNDEIGDLAQSFSMMSDSLKLKTVELMRAKIDLESLNKSLESRVDARTRELKAAQDELIKKERLAAMGQMASVVGHEIRNPLAVINNSAYYIKMKLSAAGPSDPKIAKHIGIIESEIQQANGIINEILGYARTRELMLVPQGLNGYMEDILASYPFPAGIKVEKALCHENPCVRIDVEEMKQALRNIIGNAVEAMAGAGTLSVRTIFARTSSAAVLEIGDTGPGIQQDVIDKIFTPFFTTKARGTGLGLAVVKKVMDRHKGKVEVSGGPGSGTVFRLSLPVEVEVFRG